jgi:hypothetical protein
MDIDCSVAIPRGLVSVIILYMYCACQASSAYE